MVVGLILAVAGGTIIGKLGLEKYVESYVREVEDTDAELPELTRSERISYGKEQVLFIIKKVWIAVLVGVGIGATQFTFHI